MRNLGTKELINLPKVTQCRPRIAGRFSETDDGFRDLTDELELEAWMLAGRRLR